MAFSHTTGCYAKKKNSNLILFQGELLNHSSIQFCIESNMEMMFQVPKLVAIFLILDNSSMNIISSIYLFLACANPLEANKNWVFFLKQLTPFNLRKFLSVAMCKEEPSQSHPFFFNQCCYCKILQFCNNSTNQKKYISKHSKDDR